jgi:MFS transporter, PPP family, 3-phenylpropionic acid transporter
MTNALNDARSGGSTDLLLFTWLFSALYMGFGVASPFLPAFLLSRNIPPEQIGLILSLGTLVRLVVGPIAGHLADRLQARRTLLGMCTLGAALLAGAFATANGLTILITLSLLHAALLTPTTTLADALALRSASQDGKSPPRFEYGWVRGAGSAAFIGGSLISGQAVDIFGPAAALGAQALFLASAACIAFFVPEPRAPVRPSTPLVASGVRATLMSNRPFLYLVVVAALILGSHAMHDAFAMIAWNAAGISPISGSVLWSTSVGAEIVIFFLIGPRLLRIIAPTTAMAIAACSAALRWVVMSQTSSFLALALVEPLHGLTFALLHLACMRVIIVVTPAELTATAQAIYAFGVALTSAVLTLLSGYLYVELGLDGFLIVALLALTALPMIWTLSRSLAGAINASANRHP